MRQLVSLLAVGCVVTQTVSSWAATLDYDALPHGSVGAMPKLTDAPKSVPSSKAVPGFLLMNQVQPKGSLKMSAYEYFQVSANKDDSDRMGSSFELTSCFQTLPVSSLGSVQGEWTGGGEPLAVMVLQKRDSSNQTRLYAGHVERWVESAAGVALETSDAWIDLATRSVRVYRNSSLSLVKVAEPYPGVAVYAGRTDHSVEFVVRMRPQDNEHGGEFVSQFSQGLVFTKDNESSSSSCGFVRIGLDIEPGEGQIANAVTELTVAVDPGTVDESSHNLTAGQEPTSPPPRELTLRTLGLNLSVSRLSSDLRPIAAVSYGFIGDERRVPF